MELGQLEAFVEAQRWGSITRAAEALDLTQPTVTARLRGLERELGAPLLVRGRRGVSLTAGGRPAPPLPAARDGGAGSRAPRGRRHAFGTRRARWVSDTRSRIGSRALSRALGARSIRAVPRRRRGYRS